MKHIKKEFTKDIKELIKITKSSDSIYDYVGLDKKVGSIIMNQKSYIIELLKEKYNDVKCDWIGWFVYENDFGKKGYEAGYDGNMKPIKTISNLWDLLKDEDGKKGTIK